MKHILFCLVASTLTLPATDTLASEQCSFTVPGLSSPMLKPNWKGQCLNGQAHGFGVATWLLQDGAKQNSYKVWTKAKNGVVWGDNSYDMFSMNGESAFPNYMAPGEMAEALSDEKCLSRPSCAEVMSFYKSNKNPGAKLNFAFNESQNNTPRSATTSNTHHDYTDAQNLDLSGGCTAAQQKGTQYADRIKANVISAGPAICENARNNKKLGIVMVRVAESCQEIPTWQELRAEGERMIREGEQTMNGTCN